MYYPSIIAFFTVLLFSVPVTPMPVSGNATALEEMSYMHSGTATYFDAGLGACGHTDNNNVPLVALSHINWQQSHCNKRVVIKYPKTGKFTTVLVRDKCMGCDPNHLDLTPIVWKKLGADEALGVIDIEFKGPN